jgi:hypothetical protein
MGQPESGQNWRGLNLFAGESYLCQIFLILAGLSWSVDHTSTSPLKLSTSLFSAEISCSFAAIASAAMA